MHKDKALYPLSESQKSIWYLEKAYPGTSLNIIAGNLRIKGEIDYHALGKALNLFVKKNDAMRLRIYEEDGVAKQVVAQYEEYEVEHLDFSKSGGLKELFLWDEGKTRTPFNVIGSRLYYFATYKVSDEEGGVYVKLHHLISDAWAMGLMTRQVIDLYSKFLNNEAIDESPGPSFIEHLASEAEYEKSPRFEKDKEYWSRKFEVLPEMTVLKPLKAGVISISAKRKTLITPLKLSNKIREFCAVNNVSVFTLFMSALAIYINRVTGIEDIVLGTTILNRTNYREKETAGMFVSVAAPVRISIDDSMDFKTFAKAMLKENTDVLRHQKYPYNYLIRDLKKKHKFTNRLFDIVLSYQNAKFQKKETDAEYTAKWIFSGYQVESLIISVNDREDSGNLIIDYDFLTDVFNIKEIEFIHQHIISLLWHALDNPSKKISKLEMISEKEKHIILHEFNNTYADYPRDKTIHQIFEEQAEKTPDSTALIFNDKTMTYAELNEKSNRLAHTLREKGVGPDKIVAIMTYRSFEMIIGMMGILKAGGAYMPIDPDYPVDRKVYMLNNSGAQILLTQHNLKFPEFAGEIIDLRDESNYTGDGLNLNAVNSSSDLAYVIYTSGSTGNPKGVMIQHSGVVNSYCWGVKKFSLNKDSVILQKTAPTFDPSVWEIFWWLMLGGKVCLIESGNEKDPEAIISTIERYKVTALHFVPSMMNTFLRYVEVTSSVKRLASLKQVLSCGEAISLSQVEEFNRVLYSANGTLLYNLYGPTEATVEVSCFDCSPGVPLNNVPIGKRIDNIKIYILDKNRNILPVGIPGEIYISGAGVGRGYLNSPDLTSERFLDNPFVHGEKMYRTGDRARWYPKGDIEFLGRMDFQVKVKGFRIELGEIEERLLTHKLIRDAVVKPFTDDAGNTRLIAFVVLDEELRPDMIIQYLSRSLPDYMVPDHVEILNEMPLNNNGKTDRNALSVPRGINFITNEFVPPANEVEACLAEIWSKALGQERVGVLDEYTAIGGDSLSAIRIITEIHKNFGVEVSPRYVFQLQTIRKLAEMISSMRSRESSYSVIPKIPESEYYPVSAAQKRQYILNQIDGGISYNLLGGMEINGEIDAARLENAFRTIISRHESLRTSFELRDGVPVQIVHPSVDFKVEYYEAEEAVPNRQMELFVRRFDLSVPPLLRVGLVKIGENRHILLFNTHHIISDGESVNIIMKEFVELYGGGDLPDLQVQYKDYSAWHNELLKTERIKKQETYWLDKFSGEIPVLNMPVDFIRPSFQSFRGNKLSFTLDGKLTKGIRELAAGAGTTLFMLLLASYNVLLSKYTGQEDIVVGTPVEGRRHADLHGLIGMFVNTLAIRSYPKEDKTFKVYLSEVKEELLDAYDNQEYPFEELVEKVAVKRDMSRNPVFDTMFVMRNMDLSRFAAGGFTAAPYTYFSKTSKFDLTLEAVDQGETIECSIEYCTDLFVEETIKRLAGHFVNTLNDIVMNPHKRLSDIELLSEEEHYRLLHEFNNTYADYPRDKTIHQIFEEQAEKTPDNTALIFNEKTMTYAELNEKSNRLAHTLREKGVGPDKIIAIMTYRSFEMVIGILGIMKAGGAYMPIDPDYPTQRKNYMLINSCADILLAQSGLSATIDFQGLVIDLNDENVYSPDASNLPMINSSRDLAYVIYTSGSTGSPKGVMVEHSSVVNRINWMQKKYPLDENSVIMQKTTYTFDVSVWELFWWSFAGASVCLLPPGGEKDPEVMIKLIEKHKITTMHFVPSMLQAFLYYVENSNCTSRLASLKNVFASGEALTVHQAQFFNHLLYRKNGTVLSNLYGPTEATVDVTYYDCSPMPNLSTVPIGRPIDNINLYILDKNKKLLPAGIPGELYIGGAGVARGYLNNPELTAEKFIINPYKRNEILYKTGDRVRWNPEGDIEFLGRLDNQVKVRGFRIEPGEIENRLMMHPDVEAAVVKAFSDDNNQSWLAAFVVAKRPLGAGILSDFLAESLPSYMVPSSFTFLDKMPQTTNGKIDRKALPKPEHIGSADTVYAPPDGEIETILVDIWQKVLRVAQIGVLDDYISIGGDSLKAIMIVTSVNKKWGIEVSPKDIFISKNIRELAKLIKTSAVTGYMPIPKVAESKWYPVSAAQKRLFEESQIGDGTVLNMPLCILVDGIIKYDKLKEIFNVIIRRHESLRTSFEVHDGVPVQIIHKNVEFDIEESDTDETDIDKLMTAFVRPFNLTKAPLFRVKLIHFSGKQHLLMMDTHHIISDGASHNIIFKEMAELLKGKSLPEITVQYKDFTAWYNNFLKSDEIRRQKAYWLSRLSGEIPVLNMPLDFARPPQRSMEGSTLYSTIDKELLDELKKLAVLTETTLYMLLISAYSVLLFIYTGQKDILIGIPVEGRNHPDLQDTVGSFVNNVVLRSHPSGEKTFKSYLNEVKEELINVFDNQDYPIYELAADIKHSSDTGQVFSTLFMMQKINAVNLEADTVVFKQYNYNKRRSIVDLGIGAYYSDEAITFRLEYCTKLFKEDSMKRFLRRYENILREIVGNPSIKLGDIRCEADTDKTG